MTEGKFLGYLKALIGNKRKELDLHSRLAGGWGWGGGHGPDRRRGMGLVWGMEGSHGESGSRAEARQ